MLAAAAAGPCPQGRLALWRLNPWPVAQAEPLTATCLIFIQLKFESLAALCRAASVRRRIGGLGLLPKQARYQPDHSLHRMRGHRGIRLCLSAAHEPDDGGNGNEAEEKQHRQGNARQQPGPGRRRYNVDRNMLFAQLRYQRLIAEVRHTAAESTGLRLAI